MMRRLGLLLPLLVLTACGDPAGDETPGAGTPTQVPVDADDFTFCDVQTRLYEASCLSCHGAASLLSPPILDADVSYGNTVGASATVAGLSYIVPGDADASYLLAKIDGTHLDMGGNGSRMPLGATDDTIDQSVKDGLRAWINAGAPESCGDGPTPTPTATATATAEPTPTGLPATPTPTATATATATDEWSSPTPTHDPAWTPSPTPTEGAWTPTPTPTATPTPTPTAVPPSGYTFTEVQGVWNASCAGCHTGGGSSGSLNLDDSYGKIVGVASDDIPSMSLIEANDPANSYIFLKVMGTHAEAGGVGSKMPLGGSLSTDDLDGIEGWINSGAPNN